MLNTNSLGASRCIASVILLTGFTTILGSLSCYREVAMPVIVEPIEDIHSGEFREQATNGGQDVQGLRCLSEDQAGAPPESKKDAISGNPKEDITVERGNSDYEYRSESRFR